MSIAPKSRPVFQLTSVIKTAKYFFGDEYKQFPVIILGIRPNNNRVGFFDDSAVVLRTANNNLKAFNFNTDPSAYVMRGESKSVLKLGVHFFKYSYHHKYDNKKRYQALRPNTLNEQLPVWRINKNGFGFYSSVGQSTNIHKGGVNSTWSEGCQTVFFDQYLEFLKMVGEPLGVKNITDRIERVPNNAIFDGIGNIPYILIEQRDYDYIQSLSENDFDTLLDIAYQVKRFVGVPKNQPQVPTGLQVSTQASVVPNNTLELIENAVEAQHAHDLDNLEIDDAAENAPDPAFVNSKFEDDFSRRFESLQSEASKPTIEFKLDSSFTEPFKNLDNIKIPSYIEKASRVENSTAQTETSTAKQTQTIPTTAPPVSGFSETFRAWFNWLLSLPLIGAILLAIQNYIVSGEFDLSQIIVPFLEFLKTIFPNLVWLIGFYTAYKIITGWKKQQSFQKQMEINGDKSKNNIEVITDCFPLKKTFIQHCKDKIKSIFGH
jgi:hypothetical protein